MYLINTNKIAPNVMVEKLTLMLHIREVPGSNLSLQTGYPEVL
jgi:hypothetical protein